MIEEQATGEAQLRENDGFFPLSGRPMWVLPTLETPRDTSSTLITGLRHSGQRGETTFGDVVNDHATTDLTTHHWLWAKLIQEEYPAEGYFMNTTGSRTSSWFRPRLALRDIPQEADDAAERCGQSPNPVG